MGGRMPSVDRVLLPCVFLLSACGDAGPGAAGSSDATGDATTTADTSTGSAADSSGADGSGGSEWWTPRPGEHADWDWQITEPYDVSVARSMYDLDLFDLATEGSYLEHPSGARIDVPAGPLAGVVDELHARTPRAVVVCYVDTGAYEHYRPDASAFPGHHAEIADIPDGAAPEDGSVIGWNTGWDEERWLDLREASRDAFAPILWARLDLAVRLGCDGVEPDQNNPLDNSPGFDITLDDQISWYRAVATAAHDRGLSVGMKNGHDQPGAVAALVDAFDWALPEECAEYDECDALQPFIAADKAVFAVDYMGSVDPDPACATQAAAGFDGLVKDEPPSGAHRRGCNE